MADKGSDLVVLWQKMIGEMEKGLNTFATEAMTSPEFSQAVNRAGGITAGAQKQLGEFMEKYLLNTNLPSRSQVVGLAERLQGIETQLAEIKSMLQQMNAVADPQAGITAVPRPPRTKRPAQPTAPSSSPKTGEPA